MEIKISDTWKRWGESIDKQLQEKGIENWDKIYEINLNIEVGERSHYKRYLDKCKIWLFRGVKNPHIVEFGAGYGGMVEFWLQEFDNPKITHVDIAPMLKIQKYYLESIGLKDKVEFIDTLEADKVNWFGAYLFSTFAFTETTPELWEYYCKNILPTVSGAYIYGSKGWSEDNLISFDWDLLKKTFKEVIQYDDTLFLGGVPGIELSGHNPPICKCSFCKE